MYVLTISDRVVEVMEGKLLSIMIERKEGRFSEYNVIR